MMLKMKNKAAVAHNPITVKTNNIFVGLDVRDNNSFWIGQI